MYLLDTNVVSALRLVATPRSDATFDAWSMSVQTEQLYLSSVTIMELEVGVLRLERRDERQGAVLRRWLDSKVMAEFSGRVLPFDKDAALACARMRVPDQKSDRDSYIAATGLVNGLTVVTRNISDFSGCGVPLLDPWSG